MSNKTAVNWLVEKLNQCDPWYSGTGMNHKTKEHINDLIQKARAMEEQKMIEFYRWMLKNDTSENAERFCNYSDEDMLYEFLNEKK